MSVFLNAEWRKLVMVNYAIDPEILKKYLPKNTSLDLWEGKCYVSLIGFMFMNTEVKGCKIPFHINFEEVNLRFYVYREVNGEMRRGVVFVREIVPKRMLSVIANKLYHEHYVTMPMKHDWTCIQDKWEITYQWKKEKWHTLKVFTSSQTKPIEQNSKEEFITEHYWGYTKITETKTLEYRVEHPRWSIYEVKAHDINVDFLELYGEDFSCLNDQEPDSIFMAEGSEIKIYSDKNIIE